MAAGAPEHRSRADGTSAPDGEIFLEFMTVAGQLRVVAVDAASGVEVTVFGPLSVSQDDMARIAVRKLRRRLGREPETARGRYA